MSDFRKAIKSDFAAIQNLKKEVHSIHVAAEPHFYKDSSELISQEDFEKEIASDQVYIISDLTEGTIYGYAFLRSIQVADNPIIHDQKILYIEDFCIADEYRKQGLGRELIQNIEDIAKKKNYTSIEFNVWAFNSNAIEFYKRNGFSMSRIRMKKDI
jgi:ribosomal protein S18 acetylase RimI-like enzyme